MYRNIICKAQSITPKGSIFWVRQCNVLQEQIVLGHQLKHLFFFNLTINSALIIFHFQDLQKVNICKRNRSNYNEEKIQKSTLYKVQETGFSYNINSKSIYNIDKRLLYTILNHRDNFYSDSKTTKTRNFDEKLKSTKADENVITASNVETNITKGIYVADKTDVVSISLFFHYYYLQH